MSDDDVPSSGTGTESNSVSDVDPEEMARLMEEIGNIDDDFGLTGEKDAKDSKHKSESSIEPKEKKNLRDKICIKSDNEEDWDDDADDLLKSDEDLPKTRSKDIKDSTANAEVSALIKPEFQSVTKQVAIVDKLSKNSTQRQSEELTQTTPKVDPNLKSKNSIIGKKIKEVSFDDDDDNLLELDASNKKSGRKVRDSGFMDSLLGITSETKSENKRTTKEFLLPDQYKSTNVLEEEMIRNKHTSSSISPAKVNPNSAGFSDPLEELFSKETSRTRRRTTSSQLNKPFEINDDDILGSIKRKQAKDKETNNKNLNSGSDNLKNTNQDNWLFNNSSKGTPDKVTMSISASEKPVAVSSKDKDWLNQLLTSDKISPTKKLNQVSPSISRNENISGSIHKESNMDLSPERATIGDGQKMLGSNKLSSQTSAISSMIEAQQQQAEDQIQRFQFQLQEQQQKMYQMLAQQSQMALPSLPVYSNNQTFAVEDEEAIKKLKIDLHKATTEAGSLAAELELLRKQHTHEIEIIDGAHKKKLELEKEMWIRTEERMKEERDKLIETHKCKILELLSEKEAMIHSYEEKVAATKAEWLENLNRTKELYGSVIDRMKREHQHAVERLTELKNVELQALISATGKAREADTVFEQLETNTVNLSKLATCVQERNDSAFQLSKKALDLKEKQLKDMESQLSVARAETESERNRLTVLVSRLETNLANQGTEVESEKWKLSQEKTKIEIELKALTQERQQFAQFMEKERQELSKAKQILWTEQREMMQNLVKQKMEMSAVQTQMSDKYSTDLEAEFSLSRLNEERNLLEEKVLALKIKKEELMEEEYRIEGKSLQLQEEQEKLRTARNIFNQEKDRAESRISELEKSERRLDELRHENDKKLAEIIQATQNLHIQKDTIAKAQSKLSRQENEVMHFIHKGMCPSCKKNPVIQESRKFTCIRLPGDGGEAALTIGSSSGNTDQRKFDPTSVLKRLRAAQEEETNRREEKIQIISAFYASS